MNGLRNPARIFLALFAAAPLFGTPSQAQPEGKPGWRLDKEANQSFLNYGTDNAEELVISFSCKTGSNKIRIFIAETGEDLKPNKSVIASLTAGAVTSKVPGHTLPNELAGVPSFEGDIPADDQLFAALSKTEKLVMKVGAAKQEAPLQEIGGKPAEFIRFCQKR